MKNELPCQGAGQRQQKMKYRRWVENVSAACFDGRHAAKQVGIPQRKATQCANVLNEELPEHDAGGDGVLTHQHGALAADQILAKEQQREQAHHNERNPAGDLIEI